MGKLGIRDQELGIRGGGGHKIYIAHHLYGPVHRENKKETTGRNSFCFGIVGGLGNLGAVGGVVRDRRRRHLIWRFYLVEKIGEYLKAVRRNASKAQVEEAGMQY